MLEPGEQQQLTDIAKSLATLSTLPAAIEKMDGKVDGLKQDFNDFKQKEAAVNATQDADIESLDECVEEAKKDAKQARADVKESVGKVYKSLDEHKESHLGFALKVIAGSATLVSVVLGAAKYLSH